MNIFFFGDSISFGQGVSVDATWVTRMAAQLRAQYPEKEICVNNSSLNGNTTRMALERMPYDIQSHDVDILVVGFGMNDCNYWQTDKGVPRVSKMAFEANLKEIVDRAFWFGVKKVLLRTNHPSPRTDVMINSNITYGESNAEYNEIIRKVSRDDERIEFVDIEKDFLDYCKKTESKIDDFTLKDGVHLSAEGHNRYLEIIYPVLEKLIGEC